MRKGIRSSACYIGIVIIAALVGIGSREITFLPDFLINYTGDTMWALAAYSLIRLFVSSLSLAITGLIAFGVSLFVELSQLYHAVWIDQVRATTLGALALGSGFLWSDLICYATGVLIGLLIDKYIINSYLTQKTG